MRYPVRRIGSEGGFTLLELMIASVVMAIIFMGLISSITGSFLATDMANRASEAQATARTLLEEATELSYGDALMLDGSSLVTDSGVAGKYQVFETAPGLLTIEVEVCRPIDALTVVQLAAMTMQEFRQVPSVQGSRITFTTLSTGAMQRVTGSGPGEPVQE